MTNAWDAHKEKWSVCQRCELCKTRNRVVHARGSLPADIVLLGEAPGVSENVDGRPFVGPAGKLLDRIVARGIPGEIPKLFVNLIGCIPIGEEGDKNDPEPESIKACAPRLKELVKMADPRLIVLVGKLADAYAPGILGLKSPLFSGYNGAYCSIIHPAFILRSPIAAQSLAVKKCVVTLSNAVESIFQGG